MRFASLLLFMGMLHAADFPQIEISNGFLRVKIDLPDAKNGYYRGTRFDWSGMIHSLIFQGHEYYGPWFERVDPKVHDFAYQGSEIVACPSTAAVGPAEEFVTADTQPLGYHEAAPGGTFVKIGVGALRKPDDSKYDRFRLYEIVEGSNWSVRRRGDSVQFTQRVNAAGFGYVYEKTVSLERDKAEMRIAHRLRNTGAKPIETNVYNHNFLRIDGEAPGPDYHIEFPFALAQPAPSSPLEVRSGRIEYRKTLVGEERAVMMPISALDARVQNYDISVENTKARAGVRMIGDRPMEMASLWSIRAVLAVEPFVRISIAPGQEFEWNIKYDYFVPRK